MARTTRSTVTRLLAEVRGGSRAAVDELVSLLYGELQTLARLQRRRWHGNSTLDTTALVHELYLKLVDQQRLGIESQAHFLALASRAMRQILCNYARSRLRQKRGGDAHRVSLDDVAPAPERVTLSVEQAEALHALDAALSRLEAFDRRQSAVVECRFFGGMSIEATAAALGRSPATVKRDWTLARAWLYRELEAHQRI